MKQKKLRGNDGTNDYVTDVLSHELLEGITDPDGKGIRQDGCIGGSCQIGDPCETICDRVDGIKVQGYWSEADKKCITPNWYSIRRTLPRTDLAEG